MLSVFTGRIRIPVRGTCLIQKATALAKPFSLGFQKFCCDFCNPKAVVCKHVPDVGSTVNTW